MQSNCVKNSVCALVVMVALISCFMHTIDARPMDLYDDVSDFFDAISLDDVPTSGRSAPESFCRMPARKGVCRALIPRWSYDPVKKECIEFKFGGCDGNENNFSSYKLCMDTCQGM
ncbi:kunitz-type serine protease inhibitor textilinin-3-like [Teleopsis dalmanni]|uniref:kunitz-type serine protease inhibitor textilinin-3-like n=1 Tax=Teleopsis dalmanni TaxID=139649 RepID=UPI0018CF30A8|nr:kunitz-type serine protease inhibitor textilinin-3-like [Teleopsis dalmanni]XP_037954193.1 kunitz-type serine protease inhibitor textilinin-3-like [Teleopsis dalmanni]